MRLRRIATLVGGMIAAVAALAGTAAVGFAVAHRAMVSRGPVVMTAQGKVRGLATRTTDEFLGVPYAAPPVGRLRWRAPQPAARWRGVRPARTLPPACPQNESPDGPPSTDESCLYLDVYRPRGVKAGARVPVLFWIHGGGLTTGSATEYNGSLLAGSDRIEVVSVNYRLGVLGYFAPPWLSRRAPAGRSADYGLLDQEAALRWTHRNIARFGGDPRRIAIAGESAGGYSVCALLTSPAVRGLFSRAIIESGSCVSTPLAGAERQSAAFARSLGCDHASSAMRCLRSLSAARLLHAPGLNHDFPGYHWGAGHQVELPFIWPSFNNGFSLSHRFTAGERELSAQMVRWWGAFVRGGAPDAPGQTPWPAYDGNTNSGAVMSLRPAGASVVIPSSQFGAEHECSFWDHPSSMSPVR
ncbi:MAG TPA: carboxylesterase family protein [Solirubrobacteraceae bacterium]|nr:carboxylesterase family protein [Solirubrobacteraceae bacterium]